VHKYAKHFAVLFMVASTLVGLGIAATSKAPSQDPRLVMTTTLRAWGPHASLGDQARVLARLVGAWDVEYIDFKKNGEKKRRTGELQFGWVLDGRVLQDLWVVNPSEAGKEREVYTDLFYFEPKSGNWRVASVDPYTASVANFVGSATADNQIVLESRDLDPAEAHRWSFNDIGPEALVFRDEVSSDNGMTWKVRSEYHMKRRGTVPPI
jgi:hypothetical protein